MAADGAQFCELAFHQLLLDGKLKFFGQPGFVILLAAVFDDDALAVGGGFLEGHDFLLVAAGVWAIRGSKGHRGRERQRSMPIHPALAGELRAWCEGRDATGLLFDYWRGDDAAALRRACNAASGRFATLFAYAGAEGLREHDLRHEACCRWLAMRDARGAWLFSEVEVCRMFGWSDTRIMLRYASIRGSDLAARLRDDAALRQGA